jgi:hypothetical protein
LFHRILPIYGATIAKTQKFKSDMPRDNPLTTKSIEDAQPGINLQGNPTDKSYKLYDSKGLFLQVAPAGGKWWRFKYRYGGKENLLSLGTYPLVSLNEARKKRDRFRALLKKGINPSQRVKEEKAARLAEAMRQLAASRFTLENDGGLTLQLRNRCLALTPVETMELHTFLDANRPKSIKETPCP